jgi:hypothetical protein
VMNYVELGEKDVHSMLVALLSVLNRRDEIWNFSERICIAEEWTSVSNRAS